MIQRVRKGLEVGAVSASNQTYIHTYMHIAAVRNRNDRTWAVLQDHPSWCDQVSHSSKLLQIQLTDAHINETAAAPSDPAGSWLMPGIASNAVRATSALAN